jgi:hypothetical protein
VELEVEMGCGWFCVAGIADPSDHLASEDPGPYQETRTNSDTVAVVASVDVVVEVQVERGPAVVMGDTDRTALGAIAVHDAHSPVSHRDYGCHLGRGNVDPGVVAVSSITVRSKDRENGASTQNRPLHAVDV